MYGDLYKLLKKASKWKTSLLVHLELCQIVGFSYSSVMLTQRKVLVQSSFTSYHTVSNLKHFMPMFSFTLFKNVRKPLVLTFSRKQKMNTCGKWIKKASRGFQNIFEALPSDVKKLGCSFLSNGNTLTKSCNRQVNPFQANLAFLYHLKT